MKSKLMKYLNLKNPFMVRIMYLFIWVLFASLTAFSASMTRSSGMSSWDVVGLLLLLFNILTIRGLIFPTKAEIEEMISEFTTNEKNTDFEDKRIERLAEKSGNTLECQNFIEHIKSKNDACLLLCKLLKYSACSKDFLAPIFAKLFYIILISSIFGGVAVKFWVNNIHHDGSFWWIANTLILIFIQLLYFKRPTNLSGTFWILFAICNIFWAVGAGILWYMINHGKLNSNKKGTKDKVKEFSPIRQSQIEDSTLTREIPGSNEEILDEFNFSSILREGSFNIHGDHIDGYHWANPREVAEHAVDKNIYLDNFSFSEDAMTKFNLGGSEGDGVRAAQAIRNSINNIDMSKSILLVGAMGSGKTEAINSIIDQNTANRYFINDIKGDFTQKFYNSEQDIIFNLFDQRTAIWDIFGEIEKNPEIGIEFIKNLVKASVSDKSEGDFWSNQAAKIMTESFIRNALSAGNKNEKWVKTIASIDEFVNNCGDDKTKSSIAKTMELSIDILKLMAYRSSEKNSKMFTISELFEEGNGQKIFLLNNPAYSSKLTPLFTGFLAAVTSIMLGRPDTKTDFTMFVLDEFLSLKFDNDSRLKLFTMARSKGGQNILATQFLPNDKNTKQILESSRYLIQIFQTNDGETIESLVKMGGKVGYLEESFSFTDGPSNGSFLGNASNTKNIKRSESNIITGKHIQSLSDYRHITFIPSEELLYLGYTKPPLTKFQNSPFEPIDQSAFYRFLYSVEDSKDGEQSRIEAKESEETFDEKSLEEMQLEKYLSLKFGDDQEALETLKFTDDIEVEELFLIFENAEDMKRVGSFSDEKKEEILEEYYQAMSDGEKIYDVFKKYNSVLGVAALFSEED